MAIVEQFDKLICQAIDRKASDIYLRQLDGEIQVSLHTNSGIQHIERLSVMVGEQLMRFVKYQAQMDITELRRPQAGHWTYRCAGRSMTLDLRISTVGDFLQHESMVIRLLYRLRDLRIRWVQEEQYLKLKKQASKGQGLILLAGQMGSGKTTTLYHLANEFADEQMVMTLENPVEIKNERFLQLQVNEGAGMTYADLLRLSLRHHPDILIIGEIRDRETARIAAEAGLTGHLVLSTVHAQSVAGIWYRMRELGVDEATLKQTLLGGGYQRLAQIAGEVSCDLNFCTQIEIRALTGGKLARLNGKRSGLVKYKHNFSLIWVSYAKLVMI